MFKTKFSGHNKIWEVLPLSVPSGYGPALTHVTTTLGLISSCLQRNITDWVILSHTLARDGRGLIRTWSSLR